MNVKEIIDSISSEDESIRDIAISGALANKSEELCQELTKILLVTESKFVRHDIVRILTDLKYLPVAKSIVELLNAPKTFGNRGTLLYYLLETKNYEYCEELLGHIRHDTYEVANHCHSIIMEAIQADAVTSRVFDLAKEELDELRERALFLKEIIAHEPE